MSKTTVVHVNDPDGYDVYIGRANPRRRLKRSKWSNPYKVGKDGTREEVIAKYRDVIAILIRSYPEKYDVSELRGKRLACWCAPAACHGDVLAELADAT